MLRGTLKMITFAFLGIGMVQAATLHRSPLSSTPPINAWKDNSATVGVDIRYDGTNISSSDSHHIVGLNGNKVAKTKSAAISKIAPVRRASGVCHINRAAEEA